MTVLTFVEMLLRTSIVERIPCQNCKLHQLSKDSEAIPDLRTNPAWLTTCSVFEIVFNTVETRLTLRIPKSSLTFLQIRADTERKYDRKKLVYKTPDASRNKLNDSYHLSTICLKGSTLASFVLTSDVVILC